MPSRSSIGQVRAVGWPEGAADVVAAMFPPRPWCLTAHFAALRQRGRVLAVGPEETPASAAVLLVDTVVLAGRADEAWIDWLRDVDIDPGYVVPPPESADAWGELIVRALPRARRRTFALYRWPEGATPGAAGPGVRPLAAADRPALQRLGESWIWKHFGSAEALLDESHVVGGFDGDELVAVAATFGWSDAFEDVAVGTHPLHRGEGWATRCAAGLIAGVLDRGRVPIWKTLTDNAPSRRVADKVGFELSAGDVATFRVG